MGQILPFKPPRQELEDAWAAYDAARLRVEALYRDEASTRDQRRSACEEAERLHRTFRQMFLRSDASA